MIIKQAAISGMIGYLSMVLSLLIVRASEQSAVAIIVPWLLVIGPWARRWSCASAPPWSRSIKSRGSIRRWSSRVEMRRRIAVKDLTKSYASGAATVRALDRVSLEVEGGEVALLMGPSGSGNDTPFNHGMHPATHLGQRPCAGPRNRGVERELPRLRRSHIGFVFQGFNLFPALTAGENVELALDLKSIRGRGPAPRRSSSSMGLREVRSPPG